MQPLDEKEDRDFRQNEKGERGGENRRVTRRLFPTPLCPFDQGGIDEPLLRFFRDLDPPHQIGQRDIKLVLRAEICRAWESCAPSREPSASRDRSAPPR